MLFARSQLPFLKLLFLTSLVVLTSCDSYLNVKREGVFEITGTISEASTSSVSSKISTMNTCTDPVASLVEINADNTLGTEPVAKVPVSSDGNYKFRINRQHVRMEAEVKYLVRVTGCSEVRERFITGEREQNITAQSSLLTQIINLSDSYLRQVRIIKTSQISSLLQKLEQTPASRMLDALATVLENPTLREQFESVFNMPPENLATLPPTTVNISSPLVIGENASTAYSVSVDHWNSNYMPAYSWSVNDVEVSQAANFIYSTGPQSQGPKNFVLRIGKDNGFGSIDASLPVRSYSFVVNVQNTALPTVPNWDFHPTITVTNSSTVTLRLNTGAGLANCTTFTRLGINASLVAAPLNAFDFPIDCTDAPTQDIVYTLPSGDGAKVISLWTRDSSGNDSLSPVTRTVVLDQTAPLLSVNNLPSKLKGGQAVALSFTVSDPTSGLQSVSVEQSLDGGTNYTLVAASISSPYTWTVPIVDSSAVRLRLTATDVANNTSQVQTNIFTIDSTAPLAPSLTLTSAALSNSTAVDMSLTCASDAEALLLQDSNVAPTADSPLWESCATNQTFNISTGDGLKSIYAFFKDDVGNISLASNALTMTLDQTPPVLSLNSLNSGIFKSDSSQDIAWSVSDAHLAADCIDIDYSTNNGSTWTGLTVGHSNTPPFAWTLPAIDNEQVKLRLSCTDQANNTTQVTSSGIITIDQTPPIMASVSINNGDTSTSIAFVNVSVRSSDNLSGDVFYRLTSAHPVDQSCQSMYADDNWSVAQASNTVAVLPLQITNSDGIKKICVWTKDTAGNVSTISPSLGIAGLNYDDINFFIGNPPVLTAFSVVNDTNNSKTYSTGATARISWAITDAEGLDNNPVSIEYTKDNNTWVPILTNFGGLIANPKNYSDSTTSWSIPSDIGTSYFRLRIRVKDSSGNNSIPVLSDAQNTEADPLRRWSVFAGSRDSGVGGNARGLNLIHGSSTHAFAISPITNNIFVITIASTGVQIIKVDNATGLSSTFIAEGATNLPTTMGSPVSIPAQPMMAFTNFTQITFDQLGRLYVREGVNFNFSARIWQFDLQNNTVRLYAGADGTRGTIDNASATPGTVFVASTSNVDFDDQNSLYFMTFCGGTYVSTATTAKRILKLTQNPDGSPGTISVAAGDCTFGEPLSGSLATATPLKGATSMWDLAIAVIEPDKFYYRRSGRVYKVIDGISYSTSVDSTAEFGLDYNPLTQKLIYSGSNGSIRQCNINLYSANGESCSELVRGAATIIPNCTNEGVLVSQACVLNKTGLSVLKDGSIVFMDGDSSFRVRYIDSENRLRVLAGSKAFSGDGGNKSFVRGRFNGIYYKKATEPNQAAFPEGLYFNSSSGPVFGRIEADGTTNVLAGNQIPRNILIENNTPMIKDMILGSEDSLPMGLTFDTSGLPWLSFSRRLYTIDDQQRFQVKTSYSSSGNWVSLPPGTNISNYSLDAYAGQQNFTIKDKQFFVLGTYHDPSTNNNNPNPVIRTFDFTLTPTIRHIMGGTGVTSSSDVSSPADLSSLSIASSCRNSACAVQFIENNSTETSDDELYWSEGALLRKITDPTTVGQSTLTTLFTAPSTINNFILSEDHTRLFFIRDNGKLYCHSINAIDIKTWCPQSNWVDLGPTTGLATIRKATNQMTWKNDSTLFISNGLGEIYQYTVPLAEP